MASAFCEKFAITIWTLESGAMDRSLESSTCVITLYTKYLHRTMTYIDYLNRTNQVQLSAMAKSVPVPHLSLFMSIELGN